MLLQLCLAADGHRISGAFERSLGIANIIFTAAFGIELLIKLVVLGFDEHFSSAPGMNSFDAMIVLASVSELLLGSVSFPSSLRIVRYRARKPACPLPS